MRDVRIMTYMLEKRPFFRAQEAALSFVFAGGEDCNCLAHSQAVKSTMLLSVETIEKRGAVPGGTLKCVLSGN